MIYNHIIIHLYKSIWFIYFLLFKLTINQIHLFKSSIINTLLQLLFNIFFFIIYQFFIISRYTNIRL